MLWLADAKVVSAYAQTVRVRDFVYPEILHIMYRFATGATAIYESAWAMPDSAPFVIDERMAIIGDNGFAHVQDTAPDPRYLYERGLCRPRHDLLAGCQRHHRRRSSRGDDVFPPVRRRGHAPTVITPEQSMDAMRVVLAAQESAASGSIVRLD